MRRRRRWKPLLRWRLHDGSFDCGSFTYAVKMRVLEPISIIKNRDTKYAGKAEGVVDRVAKGQSPEVDAVTGATTTSKALLKAIENSLTAGTAR